MKCELALFQESIADTQQEQDSLQNALAQKEECLEHKKQDNSELQSVISRLSLDKQQQEKHAQVQDYEQMKSCVSCFRIATKIMHSFKLQLVFLLDFGTDLV